MILLEDKNAESREEQPKKNIHEEKPVGVASVFDRIELKNFFVNYLTTMLVVEGLIFFVCFISHLASEGAGFPWKPYIFASFITPVAITFVFGIIILTFNRYLYRGVVSTPAEEDPHILGAFRDDNRVVMFFRIIHRVPFLLSMLLLIVGTGIAYKMDTIVYFLAQAGAKTAEYLFIALVTVLVVAAIGIIVWMVLSYKLRKKKMDFSYQYKKDVMDRLGVLVMDDDTLVDRDGRIVYQPENAQIAANGTDRDIPLLTRINEE